MHKTSLTQKGEITSPGPLGQGAYISGVPVGQEGLVGEGQGLPQITMVIAKGRLDDA